MMSPNSEENRARVFLKTGVAERFDIGLGYSRSGNRTNLQLTWHMLDEKRDKMPFHVLTGYGFSNTYSREQDALYLLAVKPIGRASVTIGYERLRNGRNLALFAGSYLLTQNTGLMFYSHTGSMPGEPTLYNVALVHRVGAWQMGIWYFHPSREKTVGLSLSTQFNIGGTK